MKKNLFIAFALLLQCCALQETVQRESNTAPAHREYPDSIQVVGTFFELNAEKLQDSLEIRYLDSVCSEVDFIEFGELSNKFYDVKLEKIQNDSSWFVRRTVHHEIDDGMTFIPLLKWKQEKIDTIADTTAFMNMMDAMENFVSDTIMKSSRMMYFDADLPFLFYKKGCRFMVGSTKGGVALWESPKLKVLYKALVQEYYRGFF